MSLNMTLIPMTPESIFGEAYQEDETWGLCNSYEWTLLNANNCRQQNEWRHKLDDSQKDEIGARYEFHQVPEVHEQRPVAFRVDPTSPPKFMKGPVALWKGKSITATTRRMTPEELEDLVLEGDASHVFIYRVYTVGTDPLYYVRMYHDQ